MSEHLTIPALRQAIDDADDIILKALAARFRAVQHLGDIKRDTNVPIESPSREAELKEKWKKRAKELGMVPELALLILDFLLLESKRLQKLA